MAGPMVGPLLERLGLDLDDHLLGARRRVPRPRAQPAAAREPPVHDRPGARRGRRPRDRLGRRRRPLLLHRRHAASSSTATSSPRCSPRRCCARSPARRSSTTCAPAARCPTRCRELGGTSYVNRVGHAFFKHAMREHRRARSAARSRATTTSATSGARTRARSRRCSSSSCSRSRAGPLSELVGAFRERYFISGEINSEVADQEAKMQRDRRALRRRRGLLARRRLGRLPRVALQRAPLEHRAAAAAQPRVARLARGHGAKARRGPGADPLVTSGGGARARRPRPGSTGCGSRRPFAVGRVNCYLIEDEPLTLVDTGPNSGKALDELEHQLAELGHSIEDLELVILTHQHIDHLGLVEIIAARSGADVAAIDVAVPFIENFGDDAERGRPVRRLADAAPRDPRGRRLRAAERVAELPRLGRAGANVTRPLHDGETLELRRPRARGPAPPGPQPVGHRLLGRRAPDPDRRRPPDRPHLLEPADHAARSTAPTERTAGARHLHRLAAAHARAAGRDRAPGPRRADHRPRRR